MSNAAVPSYLEIIDFIAAGTTSQAIVDYRPSELDHFVDLEHILRMAKGRARQILTSGS